MNGTLTSDSPFRSYFSHAYQSFERACAVSVHEHHIQMGGETWRLRFAGSNFVQAYLPALAHLAHPTMSDRSPALTVCLWEYDETGEAPEHPFWKWQRQLVQSNHSSFEDGQFLAAAVHTSLYIFVDKTAGLALIWLPNLNMLPMSDRAAPLRDLIELWFKPTPKLRMHAGAIGTSEGCGLLVGKGGSGKSTTALTCLLAGLNYLGDDYILVDTECCQVHSLYNTAKLVPDNLFRLPALGAYVSNQATMAEDKAILFLHDIYPEQLAVESPLHVILIPVVTGRVESEIIPAPAVAAFRALAPSTMLQATDASQEDLAKLARMVKSVPTYYLHAGTALDRIPPLIKKAISQHD